MADHLEEYVDRWLGFCTVEPRSMSPITSEPGFNMVELGAETFGTELANAKVAPSVELSWNEFLSKLNQIRKGSDRGEAEGLGQAARNLRSVVNQSYA